MTLWELKTYLFLIMFRELEGRNRCWCILFGVVILFVLIAIGLSAAVLADGINVKVILSKTGKLLA